MTDRIRSTRRRILTGLHWLLPVLAVLDWWLLRTTPLDHPVGLLAALAALAVISWMAGLVVVTTRVVLKREAIPSAAGSMLLLAGLSLGVGAGLVNWAWSLQGYVVLKEAEAMPLHHGTHLRALEQGPLADLGRLDLTLQLVELELRPTEDGLIYPESTIRVQDRSGGVEEMVVTPWKNAAVGDMRFYQGAYGFAPRIVVTGDGETLVDEIVPFTTEARERSGRVRYEGRVEADEIAVDGIVDTSSLDEAMRGHVALALEVRRDGEILGAGRLLPGHFADLDGGYRVGFAGMEQWSEIDFSRRNYRRVSLAGFMLAVLGCVWIAGEALWRRSRRKSR
jgi:hypothetical protein